MNCELYSTPLILEILIVSYIGYICKLYALFCNKPINDLRGENICSLPSMMYVIHEFFLVTEI